VTSKSAATETICGVITDSSQLGDGRTIVLVETPDGEETGLIAAGVVASARPGDQIIATRRPRSVRFTSVRIGQEEQES
jgi:hypothetical protein